MSPSVAIVILNWNGKKFLEIFLPDLLQTVYDNYRIVVADNGSTDTSVAFLRTHYPEIEIIQFTENYGFAKGYNEALQLVQSDYYVLLNSDVKITPYWIKHLVDLAITDDKIAAIQPKILSYNNPTQFEYAGAAGGWIDRLGYPFARGRIFDYCEEDTGQYDSVEQIFWASGAALFVKGSVFHEAGGFDPYFFAHQEEIDLCWRIQLLGYKVFACPLSVVYHVGGGTLPKGNSLKTYLNFRNNHIMMFKNSYGLRRWSVLVLRIVLDAISGFKALLSGDGGYFVSVFSAHLSFAKWLLIDKQFSVFPKNKKAPLTGWLNKNMAWEHFIKGKKKFSEIVTKQL